MRSIQENEWAILNRIIFEIYSTEPAARMREDLLHQLKLLIDYDSAEFFMYDSESAFKEPVFYNAPSDTEKYIKYINMSDLGKYSLSDESGEVFCEDEYGMGDFHSTADFEFLFRPYQRTRALTLVPHGSGGVCGMINLYRGKPDRAFDDRDRFIMSMIAPHTASRLCASDGAGRNDGKITVSRCVRMFGLTKREETVLRCLINGGESAEICEELGISCNTLKKHILNIYRKIGIKNRVQLFKKIRE